MRLRQRRREFEDRTLYQALSEKNYKVVFYNTQNRSLTPKEEKNKLSNTYYFKLRIPWQQRSESKDGNVSNFIWVAKH